MPILIIEERLETDFKTLTEKGFEVVGVFVASHVTDDSPVHPSKTRGLIFVNDLGNDID